MALQIKSLETALDAELFDRSKCSPVMSIRGSKLVRRAREIIAPCQALKDEVHDSPLGGVLRIGVIPSVMGGILPQTLLDLRQTHPQLMIELSSGLSAHLVGRVSKGTLDAAIVTEPNQLVRGINWQAFAQEPLVLIAPRDAEGDIDMVLLARYSFIQFQPDTYAGQQIYTLLQDREITVKPRMNLDSLESIARMVASGLGVSVVPQRSIAQPFPEGIKIVPFDNWPVKRVVGVIERVSSPKREFIEALTAALLESSV